MQQSALNWCMVLHHIYIDLTDTLDLNNVTIELAIEPEILVKNIFGKFD